MNNNLPFRLDRRDWLALALLLCAALAFVWPLFVPGWIIPQGGGDLVSFLWPTYRYAAQHLSLQSLVSNPQSLLWNPSLYSGYPFAADNQTGLFYPPNLFLFLLFPDFPYQALEALVAFHLFLAGAGMYLFMRAEVGETGNWRLEIGLVPAIAFMASDVFITHLGNYNIVAVSAYLPAIFLCLRQTFQSSVVSRPSSVHWACATGLLLGLAALAGHAQMLLIVALACGLYGLYQLIVQRHWRVLVYGGLTVFVATGIAAISLLPAFEMIQYTGRSGLPYSDASRWSLPPLGLAGMISPLVFGRGARDFWPPWDRVEFGYMGVVILALLPFARGPRTRFYWLLALVGLLIAFGAYTPVHRILFEFAPGFGSIRVPARFILLTNFALAILAGFALANLPPLSANSRWGRVGVGALVIGIFIFPLLAPLFLNHPLAWGAATVALALFGASLFLLRTRPAFLPLLLFAELFIFGGFVEVDQADPNAGYRRGPAVEYLLSQPGPFRIDVAGSQWQPDAPAVFGLESITGIANPLALAHYDRYYWSVGYRGSPQYNFLNAQFVIADKDSPPADNTFVPVFNEDPNVDVYLNTNAMPRVSLIYDAVFAPSSNDAFGLIHEPNFNPASQVVLERDGPTRLSTDKDFVGVSNLFYTNYMPGRFTVVAQTPEPAWLVVAEVWYPGWTATINGQKAEVLRANTAFLAVMVRGDSIVEFQFTSPMLTIGAIITGLTIVALAGFFVRSRR